jgi:hypothetical protein
MPRVPLSCYWCGGPPAGNDHIPPKGFYPPGTRKNLITVPACRVHNQDFKLLDERMRFYIQSVAENEIGEVGFGGATLRGMLNPAGRGFLKKVLSEMRPATLDGKPAVSGQVQAGDVELFSERLARGLHFKHYGEPLRGQIATTNTHMVLPGHDNRPGIMALEEMAHALSHGGQTDDRTDFLEPPDVRVWAGC